jgi:hypothetical protein
MRHTGQQHRHGTIPPPRAPPRAASRAAARAAVRAAVRAAAPRRIYPHISTKIDLALKL